MTKPRKQSICLFLSILTALSLTLSACGSQSAPAQTTAPTEALPTSAPTEAVVETTAAETEPTETIPPETEPTFVTVLETTYDSRLGEPVLGENAVNQLVWDRDFDAAAEQITNLGDALYYIHSARLTEYDVYTTIMALLADDYDEIGLIELSSPTAYNLYVYIGQDGIYYPFHPKSDLWPGAPTSETDLEAMCEKMMTTCDFPADGKPMTAYGYTPVYRSDLINLDGIPYAACLGAPVLGKEAVTELAKAGDTIAAAEQITNVGDAIYYMQAVTLPKQSDTLLLACNLFAGLLGDNYDEVGVFTLETINSNYGFAYIQQDGVFYQFDPFSVYTDGIGYLVSGPISAPDLDTLCGKMLASCTYLRRDDPEGFYTAQMQYTSKVPVTKEEKVTAYLTTPQYTREQIEAWVAEGLTLEQWAEKIKVPADAVQLLGAIDYLKKNSNPQDNVPFRDPASGIYWVGIWNAQEVFDHRAGNCGGVSTLMNFLLTGDVEEQGYVQFATIEGGHIFNYFVYDGVYVMCDFTRIFGPNLGDFPNTCGYIEYAGPDIQGFSDYYLYQSHFTTGFFNPDHMDYLFSLYLYPREGTILPSAGDWHGRQSASSKDTGKILPEQYKDDFVILYEKENNPIRFRSIPPVEKWPNAIQ